MPKYGPPPPKIGTFHLLDHRVTTSSHGKPQLSPLTPSLTEYHRTPSKRLKFMPSPPKIATFCYSTMVSACVGTTLSTASELHRFMPRPPKRPKFGPFSSKIAAFCSLHNHITTQWHNFTRAKPHHSTPSSTKPSKFERPTMQNSSLLPLAMGSRGHPQPRSLQHRIYERYRVRLPGPKQKFLYSIHARSSMSALPSVAPNPLINGDLSYLCYPRSYMNSL